MVELRERVGDRRLEVGMRELVEVGMLELVGVPAPGLVVGHLRRDCTEQRVAEHKPLHYLPS